MISVSEENNSIFGRLVKISNDFVDVKVTIDVGPRVIYFAAKGKNNMFYEDINKSTLGDVQDCYGGDIIKLYGGHRLWISPEEMPRCYYPDNKPVSYTVEDNSVTFTALVEEINYIQKSITLTFSPDSSLVSVDNTIKNCGVWDIELAPWSITQLAAGGIEIIPQSKRDTGYLHNRYVVLWPYSKMNDERVYFGDEFISLKQSPDAKCAFKIGTNNEDGWAAYFNNEQVFIKFFEPKLKGNYPDNGCCFETYTNSAMIEMEALGEFVKLAPGEQVFLSEEWEVYEALSLPDSKNEKQFKELLQKYISF